MAQTELPYLASREWLESEILAGRPANDRRQVLKAELEDASEEMQERIKAILDGVLVLDSPKRVKILDSGIDPRISFGPSKDELVPMDEEVISAIGELPELSQPTESVKEVVEAWEGWIELYMQESLGRIEELNANPPAAGWDGDSDSNVVWGPTRVGLGQGIYAEVNAADGALAMRDALAACAWERELHETFLPPSIEAALEASFPDRHTAETWVEEMTPEELAKTSLARFKRAYIAAKAYHIALKKLTPDFNAEMRRWAKENGSERLKLGIEDGYRMNSRYLTERLAAEAPGFYAMPARAAGEGWAKRRNSPTEQALRLRRLIEATVAQSAPLNSDGPPKVEIVDVVEPPVEVYLAEGGNETFADLPDSRGWHWQEDGSGGTWGRGPDPFEAVIVHNWLGRFTLVGAVSDEDGEGPPWVWAVPEPGRYSSDGVVNAEDPDEERPARAKRKPPGSVGGDHDIPF